MKFEVKIKINKSAKEVYSALTSTSLMTKWESNFSAFNPIKGTKRKIGSTAFRIYKEGDGSTTKIKEEITEKQTNKIFAYQLTQDNFMSYVFTKLVDKGDSVLLIEKTEIQFRPAILGFFGIFMKGSMRKRREEDLNRFKNLVEQL